MKKRIVSWLKTQLKHAESCGDIKSEEILIELLRFIKQWYKP